MASDYSVQVDDLILFFRDSSGALTNRCVPSKVYKSPALDVTASLGEIAPGWEGSVFSQRGTPPYYITNLSLLVPPGEPVAGTPYDGLPVAVKPGPPAGNDLVVIPFDDPKKGFLVPETLYMKCPELTGEAVADLRFMAEQEGTIIGNVPKFELTGISCIIIGLSNLRSGTKATAKMENRQQTAAKAQ